MTAFLVGLGSCALLGFVGWTRKILARDGWAVLAILGGLVFSSGGWTWGLLVLAVLATHFGLAWLGRIDSGERRSWSAVVAIWGSPALAALIYGTGAQACVWAAFIGATAFAGTAEITPPGKHLRASGLIVGTLTGGAMLVLHDAAAVRRGLPTGWIDLWLIPLGVVGALSGAAILTRTRRRLSPNSARLWASTSAAVVTAVVGQGGWRFFG